MKYLDEFRDEAIARALIDSIASRLTRRWVVMEVCGGQTHAIVKYGLLTFAVAAIALPVHAVGVGERPDDLRPFEARVFARELMGLK